MANISVQALFYPAELGKRALRELILSAVAVPEYDLVDFADETGGEAERHLAVPLLPHMDDIEVSDARLVLRAQPRDTDINRYSVTPGPGGKGIFLVLEKPARLKKVELQYETPTLPGQQIRVVVRQAEPSGGSFSAGPPVFSSPDFDSPGTMFPRVLTGMSLQDFGDGRKLLSLRAPLASAWLIQVATGNEATDLSPLDLQPSVNRLTIEALPRDLSIAMDSADGPVPLWSHPDVLLPESGDQEISFTLLAQKHLSQTLKTAPSAETLPVTIRFTSSSASSLAISSKTLAARYLVSPLGSDSVALQFRGDRVPIEMNAPAALRPSASKFRLTAKLLGREMNPLSPEPPFQPVTSGLRVTQSRGIAAAARFEGPNELVSARILAAAKEETEAVLEVREDAAGAPGSLLAGPSVSRAGHSFHGWLDFILPAPVTVETQDVWLTLRVNSGELFWFQGPAAQAPKVTLDGGQTWATVAEQLTPTQGLFVQLFQSSLPPLPAPTLRVDSNGTVLVPDLMSGAEQKTPSEYSKSLGPLPESVSDLLTGSTGEGRTTVRLDLFSRSVLDLTVHEMVFYYDPFQPAGGVVES